MKTPQADIEGPLIQAVVQSLDAQTAHYSVARQMRLNEARARAIAATRAKVPFWRSTPILAAAFALSAAYTFVLLTQPLGVSPSAEIEATALFEATFGADAPEESAVNPDAFFAVGAEDAGLDETVVANDLEFYAWLSETSRAERAPVNTPAGSGS